MKLTTKIYLVLGLLILLAASFLTGEFWKENYSTVYIDNKLQPGVSIRESVLHKPIYFGQKVLASTGEGFEKDLVENYLHQEVCNGAMTLGEAQNIIANSKLE